MSYTPRTQKALGVVKGLSKFSDLHHAGGFLCRLNHAILQKPEDVEKFADLHTSIYDLNGTSWNGDRFPCFARPCPKVPRHGFIESQVVFNKDELLRLFKKVLKEDPSGEMLIGPHLKNVSYNAVYVSTGTLSIGIGNDGATGGKGSVSFPVAGITSDKDFLSAVGIKPEEAMFIEAVNTCNRWYLTQIRGGPKVSNESEDFIPHTMVVGKVIAPSQDMLSWEKKTAAFPPGTVVYGGEGFTLASHAAVHCILHSIPFITTFKPMPGQTIRATEVGTGPIFNRKDFKKGVQFALKNTVHSGLRHELMFTTAVLHNWAQLRKSQYACMLMGISAVVFAKLCMALLYGEYRHYENKISEDDRNAIYFNVRNDCKRYIYGLENVFSIFNSKQWSSSFGGFAWANCTWYTMNLWKAIISIYNNKPETVSETEIASLIGEINKTVNQAHNNGWWFNKIAEHEVLDWAATEPGLNALYCADSFYESLGAQKEKNIPMRLKAFRSKSPPCAANTENKLTWAYMNYSSDLHIKAKNFVRLHNKREKISVPIEITSEGQKKPDIHYVSCTAQKAADIYNEIDKARRENGNYRIFLRPVAEKGFKLPNGHILEHKGVKVII